MNEGERIRREVLGDAHVDRAMASASGFDAAFQDFLTRYAWGEVWARPGLDRRTRSMITIALLTALGHPNELAMHVRAARRLGVAEAEIAEVLVHTSIYAGIPAANSGFGVARRALEDLEEEG